eukprot:m.22084 g.22084  ORF g.22084 m.22084 type:complete len:242 (-) comp12617_c0_seq1:253-978(-)
MIYFVTGCSRGLGLEFVKQLQARGEKIIATCRSPQGATALTKQLGDYEHGHVLPLDVANESSVADLAKALRDINVDSIDVLIHNAGITGDGHPGVVTLTETASSMRKVWETNTLGPMLVTQELYPLLLKSQVRKVFFVSSIMGSLTATTQGGSLAYRASKSAVNMVAKCFAGEHGPDSAEPFAVKLCHPGWCDTDMGSSGGRTAPVPPHASVAGMLSVIDNMGTSADGQLFVDYSGKPLAW